MVLFFSLTRKTGKRTSFKMINSWQVDVLYRMDSMWQVCKQKSEAGAVAVWLKQKWAPRFKSREETTASLVQLKSSPAPSTPPPTPLLNKSYVHSSEVEVPSLPDHATLILTKHRTDHHKGCLHLFMENERVYVWRESVWVGLDRYNKNTINWVAYQQIFIFHCFRSWEIKTIVSGEDPLPHWQLSSHCDSNGRREQGVLWGGSLLWDHWPQSWGPCPHDLITPQKSHLLIVP